MIRRELGYFFAALTFYTRIPGPPGFNHNESNVAKSRKYLPLVGLVIGTIGIIAYWLAQYLFPPAVALILSVTATIFATGAFHEDGFADTCDGFGGGWSREQIISIMKDSRIGAYGCIGIVLILLLKLIGLYEIQKISTSLLLIGLLNGHSLSRLFASLFIQTHQYVQDTENSKSKSMASARLNSREFAYSAIYALLPLVLFAPNWIFVTAVIPAYLSKVMLSGYFTRRIGGFTGDCLGAVQQVSEVVFILSILALCKYF